MNIVNKIIDCLVIYLIKNYLLVITDSNLGEVWWRGLYHHVKQNLWEQKNEMYQKKTKMFKT